MILSKLVSNIVGGLGHRSSGKIGTVDTATAVLDAINQALKQLPITASPEFSERIFLLSLTEGTFTYALPTADINSKTVAILDLLSHQLYDADDNRMNLTYELSLTFDHIHDYVRTNTDPAPPRNFMRYGKKLYFAPTPDAGYTLYMRAKCMIPDLTSSDLAEAIPVGDEWLYVVQAFATHYLYTQLQQIQLSSFWFTVYTDNKASVEHVHERLIALRRDKGVHTHQDPLTDPYNKTGNIAGGYY